MLNCEMKPYLNYIMNNKSIIQMLKLRAGNHTLSVETDRYRDRKSCDECICCLCDSQKIRDVYHVIVVRLKLNYLSTKMKSFPNDLNKTVTLPNEQMISKTIKAYYTIHGNSGRNNKN